MTDAPYWPLSSEDGDWFALDGALTRHEAASEFHHNLLDWWVAERVGCDDDDQPTGKVAAMRRFLERLKRGHIRPFEPGTDDDEFGEPGWWFNCDADHPKAVAAWVWE